MDAEIKCDCCKDTKEIGVCCSSLGPISFAYCYVCLAMGAEPEDVVKNMIDSGILEGTDVVYYDTKSDSYMKIDGTIAEISTKTGKKYKTKSEYIASL